MIILKDVCRTYSMENSEVLALKDVNLHIRSGEFVSIMGPSGSGKSTLLNILGCLDIPSSGHYHLSGQEVSFLNDRELSLIRNKHLGFVFQSFNLLPRNTALQNVALPLAYAGYSLKEQETAALSALHKVGLANRSEHRPSELSGGQKQRVAIARALVNNPNVILADEPTGNLDSKSGAVIMNLLGELNNQGLTLVLVTHDTTIASYSKRVIRLSDGQVCSDEVYSR